MNHRSVHNAGYEKTAIGSKAPLSKILKAALDLFSTKGYEETKMSDIAGLAGLSVGALYLRFRSKEDLCLAVINDQTKDYESLTGRFLQPQEDPLQSLKDYIEFCLGYAFRKKQLLSMFMREHRLSFIRPMRKKFLSSQQAIIRNILTAGMKKRVFKSVETEDASLMIFACIRGAVLMKIMFGVGDAGSMSASLFQLITLGIKKEKP